MTVSDLLYRRVLLVSAAILVIVGLALILGVVPPVKADTHPGAAPERAALGFVINIALSFVTAIILVLIFMRSGKRSRMTPLVVMTGLVVLFLGIVLIDAGSAFQSHGPSMQTVSIILFLAATADILTGATVITATLLQRKNT